MFANTTRVFSPQPQAHERKQRDSAMGLHRKLTKSVSFDNNTDMKVLVVKTIHRRKQREGRIIHLQRMAVKAVLLSVCFGGTLIVSTNVAFAYIPNNGMSTYSRTIRRNPAHTRTVVSSSKIAPDRPNQVNATDNSNGDIDDRGENVLRQSLDNNENPYPLGENFFPNPNGIHEDSNSNGLQNLEKLSIELESDLEDLLFSNEKLNGSSQDGLASPKYEIEEDEQMKSNFDSGEEQSFEDDKKGPQRNAPRSSILRRIRPLKRIKRFFGGSSSKHNGSSQMNDDIDLEVPFFMNVSSDNADDDLNAQKPSIRDLWRKRHARTLEEGIRRERIDTLSFLMNRAIVNARPNQERSYIERSLMGLINGVAEEVEDLDITLNTRSKSPFWRKEVEEIRINFSRLGFRPLQLGGTDSVVEIVDADNDVADNDKNITDGLDAFVTNSIPSEDQGGVRELSFVESADEGFDRIDEDGSGTLDKDELAQALNSISGIETDKESIQELASDLVRLYDDNGDGVVDREEYKKMVEDMANLRALKEEEGERKNPFVAVKDSIQSVSEGISSRAGEVVSAARDKYFSENDEEEEDSTEMGSIVLSKVNMDLRRLVFGGIPIVKKITPGGPLILEPFTATVIASWNREDVMGSILLDAALKRLVARALRVRLRSYRDLTEGALFVGRSYKLSCKTAPVVEVLELSNVEFDSRDKMIVTGRARFRADPDAPVVTSTFKLRTKIGTRKNGQVIKLKEPELAFVFECPKALEDGLSAMCETFGLPPPKRPEPYYSFFPIYSPFKVDDDTGGYDMGEDNCIRSIFIKNGKLRFEMSVVLRPGRFLGNHYLAFTVPQRTFIITMDRVWNGVQAARKNKQVADQAKKMKKAEAKKMGKEAKKTGKATEKSDGSSNALSVSSSESSTPATKSNTPLGIIKTIKENTPKPKSFYTRFVEGYTRIEKEKEADNERITNDISDWFGRQGM